MLSLAPQIHFLAYQLRFWEWGRCIFVELHSLGVYYVAFLGYMSFSVIISVTGACGVARLVVASVSSLMCSDKTLGRSVILEQGDYRYNCTSGLPEAHAG